LALQNLNRDFDKTEEQLRAFQAYGQNVGETLKQIDDERFIIKASNGPRYVVGVRQKIKKERLKPGTRVALDLQTLTIMRILPREVDPMVFNMLTDGTSAF
jgi:26S proteasome regulatory subunit T4